ncbi:MAG: hypothetical protein K8S56_09120 [Candidatus Cloacimonetes bacterium]|nr:hypothetical protein [Candidatus Cloacimonadota bacterium]
MKYFNLFLLLALIFSLGLFVGCKGDGGGDGGITGLPDIWNPNIYDHVITCDYNNDAKDEYSYISVVVVDWDNGTPMQTIEVRINDAIIDGNFFLDEDAEYFYFGWHSYNSVTLIPGEAYDVAVTINGVLSQTNLTIVHDQTNVVWPVAWTTDQPMEVTWDLVANSHYQFLWGYADTPDPNDPMNDLEYEFEVSIPVAHRSATIPTTWASGIDITQPDSHIGLYLSNTNVVFKGRNVFMSGSADYMNYYSNRAKAQQDRKKQHRKLIETILNLEK